MSSKDKAQQLIYAFEAFTDREHELEYAKQCALIAVDEILMALDKVGLLLLEISEVEDFYKEVKNEIIKL